MGSATSPSPCSPAARAGKTTLLDHLLANRRGTLRRASRQRVERDTRRCRACGGHEDLHRAAEKLVELTNGCIDCTLREDLLSTVGEFAHGGRHDTVLVESTRISEAMPVAALRLGARRRDQPLRARSARLQGHCGRRLDVPRRAGPRRQLAERDLAASDTDERAISDLLVDQVEFADTLVATKSDLVTPAHLDALEAVRSSTPPPGCCARVARRRPAA